MEYSAALLIIRFVIHVLSAYWIIKFDVRGKNYRWTAAATAALIAGSSFGAAMQIITQWDLLVASQPMPWITLLCGAFLWKIYRAGGNVAKMFQYKPKEAVNGTDS